MNEENIKITVLYGHIELVDTVGFKDGAMLFGGYSIHYDEQGKEVKRTPNEWNGRLTWGRGD